jgi:hypothetical protein
MATVAFSLYDNDGNPLSGVEPAWLTLRTPSASIAWAGLTPPPITEIDTGSYTFTVDAAEDVAYLLDCGPDSNPRYVAGGTGNVVAFVLTRNGDLLPGQLPTFVLYRELTVDATLDPPPIRELGFDGGLYAFSRLDARDEGTGLVYRIDCGPLADARYLDGVFDPGGVSGGISRPIILRDEDEEVTTNRLSETFRSLAYYPPNGERFVAKTCQLVIRFNSSIEGGGESGDVRFRSFGIRYNVLGRRPA